MKTTIDVPDEVLHKAKVVGALARLEKGMRLGGKFIARDEIHARR